MTRYTGLLKEYASLANQELAIADTAIGLASEGDPDSGNLIMFSTLGRPTRNSTRPLLPPIRLS